MTNNIFCTNCGVEYTHRDVYCSNCGMSVEPEMSILPSQDYQTHCTSCGTNIGVNYTYCAACGTECTEYIINTGVASQIMGVFGGLNVAESVANIADKTVGIKNVLSTLRQLGDKSTLAPAFMFAIVAVAVGLILSLIIDVFIVGALGEADFFQQLGMWDVLGTWIVPAAQGGEVFRLGFTTIWLLTLLGGLRNTVSIEFSWGHTYEADSLISLGLIWLIIVPLIALLIARQARNAYIRSTYPGKEIRSMDGLLGAGLFTIANLIIALFPTALGRNVQNTFELWDPQAGVNATAGPLFSSLLLFSFAFALIFAMPNLHSLRNSEKIHSRIAGISIGTAVKFVKLMVVAGLIIAVVAGIYGLMTFISELDPSRDEFRVFAYSLLAALPNLAVWFMSFLTGGSLVGEFAFLEFSDLEFGASITANAFGTELSGGWWRFEVEVYDFSWFGLLILVAGFWIAVSVFYKMLRNEKSFAISGIISVVVSAVLTWIISRAATFAVDSTFIPEYENYGSLGTASSGNFLLIALFAAIAVFVVFIARKVPTVDLIVKTLAKPAIALIVTAVAATVAVLTVSMNG